LVGGSGVAFAKAKRYRERINDVAGEDSSLLYVEFTRKRVSKAREALFDEFAPRVLDVLLLVATDLIIHLSSVN